MFFNPRTHFLISLATYQMAEILLLSAFPAHAWPFSKIGQLPAVVTVRQLFITSYPSSAGERERERERERLCYTHTQRNWLPGNCLHWTNCVKLRPPDHLSLPSSLRLEGGSAKTGGLRDVRSLKLKVEGGRRRRRRRKRHVSKAGSLKVAL